MSRRYSVNEWVWNMLSEEPVKVFGYLKGGRGIHAPLYWVADASGSWWACAESYLQPMGGVQ